MLSGSAAFQLHDTYGFPIDLTLEMAAEQGLSVDEPGFRALMQEQRDRAKRDAKDKKGLGHVDVSVYRSLLDRAGASEFTGYGEVRSESVESVTCRWCGRSDAVELVSRAVADAASQPVEHCSTGSLCFLGYTQGRFLGFTRY